MITDSLTPIPTLASHSDPHPLYLLLQNKEAPDSQPLEIIPNRAKGLLKHFTQSQTQGFTFHVSTAQTSL